MLFDFTEETKEETNLIVENELIDISNEEYHGDKDYISCSGLKQLKDNPYLFFHPEEKEQNQQPLDFGNAFHTLLLEPHLFDKQFVVAPNIDKRTKAGKEEFIQFQQASEGKILLTDKENEILQGMMNSCKKVPYVEALLKDCVFEKSYFTEKEFDGETYKVKVRADAINLKLGLVIDLKSCVGSSPNQFKRQIATYNYHMQDAFYKEVLGLKKFVFIAVDKKPPYMVGIYTITDIDSQIGLELCKQSLKRSKEQDKYKYPLWLNKAGEVIQDLVLPNYVHYDLENEGE